MALPLAPFLRAAHQPLCAKPHRRPLSISADGSPPPVSRALITRRRRRRPCSCHTTPYLACSETRPASDFKLRRDSSPSLNNCRGSRPVAVRQSHVSKGSVRTLALHLYVYPNPVLRYTPHRFPESHCDHSPPARTALGSYLRRHVRVQLRQLRYPRLVTRGQEDFSCGKWVSTAGINSTACILFTLS